MKSPKNPVLSVRNVWKTYSMGSSSVHALRSVSLDVFEGEFLALQGASGSGKSTLMHIIGCLDVPSSGSVLLSGHDVSKLSDVERSRVRGRTVGFVFQKFHLLSTLTAVENVALPLLFQDVPVIDRMRKARELLVKLGLGDRLDHKPSQLSGGQQQRVAIARSLIADPSILLADEPTGNLDSKTGREVMELLKDLHSQGRTVILVTHDALLARTAGRVVMLKDGAITQNCRKSPIHGLKPVVLRTLAVEGSSEELKISH